jgi:hypothetical protein
VAIRSSFEATRPWIGESLEPAATVIDFVPTLFIFFFCPPLQQKRMAKTGAKRKNKISSQVCFIYLNWQQKCCQLSIVSSHNGVMKTHFFSQAETIPPPEEGTPKMARAAKVCLCCISDGLIKFIRDPK